MKGNEMSEKLNVPAVMEAAALGAEDDSCYGDAEIMREARAAVIELAAAVRERMALSSHTRDMATGKFAASNDRIDAALAFFEVQP